MRNRRHIDKPPEGVASSRSDGGPPPANRLEPLPTPEGVTVAGDPLNHWARKRQQMALSYLEWLAATARLEPATLLNLERLYPDLGHYAKLGHPLKECSIEQLRAIASGLVLLIGDEDLTPHLSAGALNAAADPQEWQILIAWLSQPRP